MALVTGDKLTLNIDQYNLISIVIDEPTRQKLIGLNEAIRNSGTIQANSGKVYIDARTADGLFESAVNTDGVIQADRVSIDQATGEVILLAHQDIDINGRLTAGKITIGDQQKAIPEDVTINAEISATEDGIKVLANEDIVVNADITSQDADIELFADYNQDLIGEFTQLSGTIKATGQGDIYIDGSGTMTLGRTSTDAGAIKIGTRHPPSQIAGDPYYIHTQGDIEIIQKNDLNNIKQLVTQRGDILLYDTAGKLNLEATSGAIKDFSNIPLQANYLNLIANSLFVETRSSELLIYKNLGDINIDTLITQDGVITISGEDINIGYLTSTNLTLKTDGGINTNNGAILTASSLTLISDRFGSYSEPLYLNSSKIHLNKINNNIDIIESVGLGTTILLRGPPDGWGSIVYNKDTNLILQAQRISVEGTQPIYFYGDITFYNFFSSTPTKEIYFEAGKTYTFRGYTYIGIDHPDWPVYLRSSQKGSYWYIKVEGDYLFTVISVGDSYNLGTDVLRAHPSRTEGNNVNWNLNTIVWIKSSGSPSTYYNWSDPTNWSPNGSPDGQAVLFDASGSRNALIDQSYNILSLTINGYTGEILQAAGSTLTISGYYTQSTGTFSGGSDNITISGDFTLSGGTFTSTSATLSIGGNMAITAGTFNNNSGTIDFTASTGTQTLNSGAFSFYNINHTGAGILQLTTNALTVSGSLNQTAGILDLNGQNLSVTGTFTIAANTDLQLIGSETVSTPSLGTDSTVTYTGTAGPYTLQNWSYENLVLNGSGGTFTLGATLTAKSLTIYSGTTLDLAGYGISFTALSSPSNSGTIKLIGTETFTNVSNLDIDSGTVEYLGDGDSFADTFTLLDWGATDYYNLIINATDGTTDTFQFTSSISVANNLTVTAGTIDFNAQSISITGNLKMDIGSQIIATSTAMDGVSITVGGDLDLDGETADKLTFSWTSAWTLSVTGNADMNYVSFQTTSTTSMTLTVSGNRAIASNVDVEYSNALGGTQISATDGTNTDNGNNTNWNFTLVTISISGTVYSDEGTTAIGSGYTVAVSVNGNTSAGSDITDATGAYLLTGIAVNTGSVITLYLDNHSEDAVTITISNGTDLTNVDLYQNYLIVRDEITGDSIRNVDLDVADNNGDTDISALYSTNGTSLTVADAKRLLIPTGHTFSPKGDVTVERLIINGTYVMPANGTLKITGSGTPLTGSGSLDTTTNTPNTVEYTGPGTTDITAATPISSYYNLSLSPDAFQEVGIISLNSGEGRSYNSSVVDTVRGYLYIGLDQNPGKVVKVDLSTFTRVGILTLSIGNIGCAGIDEADGYAYFGENLTSAKIAKVNIQDPTFSQVATYGGQAGKNYFRACVIDPNTNMGYFGTNDSTAYVVKIDLSTMSLSATWDSTITYIKYMAIDLTRGYIYVSQEVDPTSVIVKLDLTPAEVDSLTLTNINFFRSVAIDPSAGYLYYGRDNGVIEKININHPTFSYVGSLTVTDNTKTISSGVIDTNAGYGYFWQAKPAGTVYKIDLSTFSIDSSINTNVPPDFYSAALIDTSAGYLYLVSNKTTVQVCRVKTQSTDINLGTTTLQTLTINGNLIIGDGTNPAPVDASAYDPTINIGGDFTINFGASFTASDTNTLTVGGSWTNSGTFTNSSGSITFDATDTDNTISTGGASFNNLTFNGTGGLWSLSSDLTVAGTLTITAGTLDANGFNISVTGTFTVQSGGALQVQGTETISNPTLDTGSEVIYNGSGSYTGLSLGYTYSDLTFSGTGTYSLTAALTVNNKLSMTAGTLDPAGFGITLGSGGIVMTGSSAINSASSITLNFPSPAACYLTTVTSTGGDITIGSTTQRASFIRGRYATITATLSASGTVTLYTTGNIGRTGIPVYISSATKMIIEGSSSSSVHIKQGNVSGGTNMTITGFTDNGDGTGTITINNGGTASTVTFSLTGTNTYLTLATNSGSINYSAGTHLPVSSLYLIAGGTGGVGTSANYFLVNANFTWVKANGDVYIEAYDNITFSKIDTSAVGGNINLRTWSGLTGDIKLGTINAGTGAVNINAMGSILNDNSTQTKITAASNSAFTAQTGMIGSWDNPLDIFMPTGITLTVLAGGTDAFGRSVILSDTNTLTGTDISIDPGTAGSVWLDGQEV